MKLIFTLLMLLAGIAHSQVVDVDYYLDPNDLTTTAGAAITKEEMDAAHKGTARTHATLVVSTLGPQDQVKLGTSALTFPAMPGTARIGASTYTYAGGDYIEYDHTVDRHYVRIPLSGSKVSARFLWSSNVAELGNSAQFDFFSVASFTTQSNSGVFQMLGHPSTPTVRAHGSSTTFGSTFGAGISITPGTIYDIDFLHDGVAGECRVTVRNMAGTVLGESVASIATGQALVSVAVGCNGHTQTAAGRVTGMGPIWIDETNAKYPLSASTSTLTTGTIFVNP